MTCVLENIPVIETNESNVKLRKITTNNPILQYLWHVGPAEQNRLLNYNMLGYMEYMFKHGEL